MYRHIVNLRTKCKPSKNVLMAMWVLVKSWLAGHRGFVGEVMTKLVTMLKELCPWRVRVRIRSVEVILIGFMILQVWSKFLA